MVFFRSGSFAKGLIVSPAAVIAHFTGGGLYVHDSWCIRGLAAHRMRVERLLCFGSGGSLKTQFTPISGALLMGVACLSTMPANADEHLETVTVTATRVEESIFSLPGAASVVDKSSIQAARQQLSLDESLNRVPGVFLQNRYNAAQDLRIAIRGFGARSNFGIRGVKILIDGIPETMVDGQGQIDSIDLGATERIEVLRGGLSSLYGNASGGVVNILSESGGPEPFVEARLSAGEFGFRKAQVKAGGDFGVGDYFVSASNMENKGHRDHSESKNKLLSTKLRFRPSDSGQLSLVLGLTDQPVSNDPGGITKQAAEDDPTQARDRNVLFDAGEDLKQQKLGALYEHTLANEARIAARAYYLNRDFNNKLPFVGGGAVDLDRQVGGVGFTYTQELELFQRWNRFIAGIDYDNQDDRRKRFDNELGTVTDLSFDQTEQVIGTGVFAQWEIRPIEPLELTFGLRYDDIKFEVDDKFLADGDDSDTISFNEVSPLVGMLYTFNPAVQLYANISSAFETPTATEFARADGGGGINTDLKVQKATNYELGLRGGLGLRYGYEVALFHIDVKDELIPYEVPTRPGRDFYVNAGESARDGLEVSVFGEPLDGLSLTASYTYSDFTFSEFVDDNGNDYKGNTIPGVPKHFAFAEAKYLSRSGFLVALDAQYVGSLYTNNANTEKTAAYWLMNLRMGLQADYGSVRFEPFIGLNNLTGTDYAANIRINAFGGRYYEPGPGRHVYGGFALSYHY